MRTSQTGLSMPTVSDLTRVLSATIKDEDLFRQLLSDPYSVRQRYPELDQEQAGLLVALFMEARAQMQRDAAGRRVAEKRLQDIFSCLQRAFTDLRLMNWIAFIVGLGLVVLAVWLGVTGQDVIYAALFGTMGVVTLVAYLIFKPMRGVRNAISEFLQAHIIFDTANHQIGVWYTFKPGNLHEAQAASRALGEIRETSVDLLRNASKERTKFPLKEVFA